MDAADRAMTMHVGDATNAVSFTGSYADMAAVTTAFAAIAAAITGFTTAYYPPPPARAPTHLILFPLSQVAAGGLPGLDARREELNEDHDHLVEPVYVHGLKDEEEDRE